MNTTLLRARDIEAYALSTLTIQLDTRARDVNAGDRTVNPAPATGRFARTRRLILTGAILGIAAPAVAFGFVNARVFTSTAADTHQSPKAVALRNEQRTAEAEPAAAIFAALVASGALTMLADGNGHAPGPRPPQIDPFDLMSKAQGLADEKIENLF